MSGQAVPVDLSGHMLDLEEDEDLEVFTKVKLQTTAGKCPRDMSRCCRGAPDVQPANFSERLKWKIYVIDRRKLPLISS